MNEDNPINSILVWRQTLSARIRANDPNLLVDPKMSAAARAKLADAVDVGNVEWIARIDKDDPFVIELGVILRGGMESECE